MDAAHLLGWGAAVLLVSVRLSMIFLATPLFGAIPVPVIARLLLVLGLAAGMAQGVTLPEAVSLPQLVLMVLHEAVVGGAIALGLFAGFGAFHFAGRLLDSQIGFGVAGLVDIATQTNPPLIGSLLTMTAVLVFFAIDGHLALLRVLHLSLDKLPPGGSLTALNMQALIAQFGACFVFGLIIVAPLVVCLLLIDFAAAFMSRTMPQMNVFVLSMSLKVIVGLLLLAMMMPLASGVLRRVFEAMFSGWARMVD